MNAMNCDPTTTRIDARFNGPPDIGNGGIVCAVIAHHCGDTFEAELRRPAPLDQPLQIDHEPGGDVVLRDGDFVVAVGRACELDVEVPRPPTPQEVAAAQARALDTPHPFPYCFVCGPKRDEGDGLRAIAGPVAGREGMVATPWRPHPDFVDPATGTVERRFVWAALDCPGGLAALAGRHVPILLARFRGRIERCPDAGETCTLMGWTIESSGRKHVTGTALLGGDGRVLGRAEALWIEPKQQSVAA